MRTIRFSSLQQFGAFVFAAAALGLACASDASAQQENKSDQIEEIIVTAQKREEPLSKAPLAITAISQEQLQAAGVIAISDLPSVAPSVEVTTYPLLNNIQMSIRGIASLGGLSDPLNPAVATYVDGVYIPSNWGLQGALYDLARVEVLRGPQGTLYGRNATAGSINILTADPQPQFGAAFDISAGNYGDTMSHGMINLPVDDTLAVRGDFYYHRSDGFYDTEGTTGRNLGAADDRGARITALWSPTSNFKWRLAVDDFVSDGTQIEGIITAPNGAPAGGAAILRGPVQSTPEPEDDVNNFSVRSRMDWQVSNALALAYIAGYQTSNFNYATLYQASPTPYASSLGFNNSSGIYQEINLNLDTGRWKNIVGATYASSRLDDLEDDPIYPDNLNEVPDQEFNTRSWGVFDQATFRVINGLRLVGGLRYSHDEKSYFESLYACPIDVLLSRGASPTQCTIPGGTFNRSASWSKVNWKAGIEYDLSDVNLAYFSVTTGYKAGGFNTATGANPPSPEYKPEDITNYELGFKNRLFDGRASLNVALFYEDYTNIQVTEQEIFPITVNAAAARIYGAELEGSWKLTTHDRIDAFFTALSATYTNYTNALNGQTGAIVADLDGNHLPNAPDYSGRIQYAHDFPLPNGGQLTPTAALYVQSVSYLREFNLPVDRVPAYTKTILRLAYQDPTDHWHAEAYVDNLENNLVRVGYQTIFGLYDSYYAPPRTYGARLSYRY
jgi:iron complex outermembrane recepter protein